MADQTNDLQGDNTQKNPQDWATGGEPATGAQMSYVKTMAQEAGESVPDEMTKTEASEKIAELQKKTGRDGTPANE